MKKHKYHTTTEAFDRLWAAVHKSRTDTVKVSIADLSALLMDHSALCNIVKEDSNS